MRIGSNRAVGDDTSSARNRRTPDAAERVCECKYECVIAVCAAASAFDAGRSAQRKIDLEHAGTAVSLARDKVNQLQWRRCDDEGPSVTDDAPRIILLPAEEKHFRVG